MGHPENKYLFIQRSALSFISPQEMIADPMAGINELLNGSVRISRRPEQFDNIDKYSSRRNPYQRGNYSYRVTVCLPQDEFDYFQSMQVAYIDDSYPAGYKVLRWDDSSIYGYASIAQLDIDEFEDYPKIIIPEELKTKLLSYILVYGGQTAEDDTILDELFIGGKVEQVMEAFKKLVAEETLKEIGIPKAGKER